MSDPASLIFAILFFCGAIGIALGVIGGPRHGR